MALLIEIKAADGLVSRTRLEPGANRFSVRVGDSYRLIDDQTGLTPQGLAVKRVDNNLVVDKLGAAGATVEFVEFYSVCSAGSPCDLTVDTGSGASLAITPGTQPIGALADGSFVLYDPTYAETALPTPSAADGAMVRNILYGVGGLAVVGLAAGGGGGGGGDGNDGPAAPSGTLKLSSPQLVNSRTPTLSGEGEPGSRVIVRIDTNGDGAADVTYNTLVGSDARWSINLGSTPPESGALPPGGLPDASIVSITSATSAGNISLPVFTLTYDGAPPAPAVINAVATDNVVNAAEKAAGVVVSGSAEAGSLVTINLGAQLLGSATAGADGQWQTTLSGSAVPADGNYVLSAVVQDPAGNLSSPSQSAISVNTAPAALSASPVAGDNRLNAAEAAGSINFTGTAEPNATVSVSWNGVSKEPVTAGANGTWNVAFAAAEAPSADGVFGYTIAATNPIGNSASQTGQVTVDRTAPSAPTISPVAGDNVVNQPEAGAGVAVSGTAEPGASVSVRWGTSTATASDPDRDGIWSTTFSSGSIPSDGTYSLVAVATDAAGNSSPQGTRPGVIVNSSPPALTVNAIAGDGIVTQAEAGPGIVISGTTEAGANVTVTWGGSSQSTVSTDGTWAFNFAVPAPALPGGETFSGTVRSTDTAGNSTVSPISVVVDTIPPIPAGSVLVDGDNNVASLEPYSVTGTAEAGTSVSVQVGTTTILATFAPDGITWTAGAFPAEIVLGPPPATATAVVTVTDAVGNLAVSNHDFTVAPLLPDPTAAPTDPALALDSMLIPGDSEVSLSGFNSSTTSPRSDADVIAELTPIEYNHY